MTVVLSWMDEIQNWIPGVEEPKTKVDIRSVVNYAEDKHKDDVAVPTKKWKYL